MVMVMANGFITCHIDGEPIMINISDISYVTDNDIFLRSRLNEEDSITVDESFDAINDKLCKELNNE